MKSLQPTIDRLPGLMAETWLAKNRHLEPWMVEDLRQRDPSELPTAVYRYLVGLHAGAIKRPRGRIKGSRNLTLDRQASIACDYKLCLDEELQADRRRDRGTSSSIWNKRHGTPAARACARVKQAHELQTITDASLKNLVAKALSIPIVKRVVEQHLRRARPEIRLPFNKAISPRS